MRRSDRSTPSPRPSSGRRVGILTAVSGAMVLLAAAPGTRPTAASGVVEMKTETLAPISAEDRGSIYTRGVGVEPVISATEENILAAARIAVEAARARDEGSTTLDGRGASPQEIEREKLEHLSTLPTPSADTTGSIPDAAAKGE